MRCLQMISNNKCMMNSWKNKKKVSGQMMRKM